MTTTRKSESARANGAKSRGPITPEGKLASSQNATKHGIFSRTIVLQCESQDRFEQVLAALKDQVQPRNASEAAYVETMAIARWRQMRVWGIQKAAIELEMASFEAASNGAPPPETTAELTPVVLATLAYRNLAGDSCLLDMLHRYETSYDRQFAKAQAAIHKMRRQELLEAKASASAAPNLLALVPQPATPLTAATFMEPSESPEEEAFLQMEPTTQNET